MCNREFAGRRHPRASRRGRGRRRAIPGERGRRWEAQRRAAGIALPHGTAAKLAELAARLAVEVPARHDQRRVTLSR